MINYFWPLALVVLSNVLYQICAKSVPGEVNPFASLTVTYLIGAVFSFVLYFILGNNGNIIQEYKAFNWAPFAMGFAIVGLEVGYIYAYKNGWPVSVAQIVQAAVLAVVLVFVGLLMFGESITWNKIVGIVICLVGLGLITL